jgi:hypothetical protein
MRVKVRVSVFRRLQEIATEEKERTKESTTVSDLVRSALGDYISVYAATSRLYPMLADKKAAN